MWISGPLEVRISSQSVFRSWWLTFVNLYFLSYGNMLTSCFCSLLTLSETVAMPKAVESTKSSVLVGFLEPFEKTVTKPPLAKAIFAVFFCQYYCSFFWKGKHFGNILQLQNKNRCQAIPTRLRNPVTFYACVRHWRCVLTQFCCTPHCVHIDAFCEGVGKDRGLHQVIVFPENYTKAISVAMRIPKVEFGGVWWLLCCTYFVRISSEVLYINS